MKILFLIAIAWGSKLRAGCNNVNKNGKSECFQQWKKSGYKNTKEALQCCMSYKKGDISEFNVPIIVLPYGEQREYRTDKRGNIPEIKCYPESFKEIDGFFNFLDLYRNVPFSDYEKNPSLNWNCFNTNDTYNGRHILKPIDKDQFIRSSRVNVKNREKVEERTQEKQNFCRTLLFKYHLTPIGKFSSKDLRRDVCDNEKIYPYQSGRPIFSLFDLEKQSPRNRWIINEDEDFERKFKNTISMRNSKGNVDKTRKVTEYNEKRSKNNITVFEDFRPAWKEYGVQFQEQDKYPVLRQFHCGCFDTRP